MEEKQSNIMEKPVSLIIDDFRKDLFTLINSYKVHPSILNLVFKEVQNELEKTANIYAEQEKLKYKSYQEESTEK